jgi:tetratricopeptide (TPR) repeat protein
VEAQALYERVLANSPKHPKASYLLGVCHLQQGQPAVALPLLEKAVAAKPDFAEGYGNLGAALNALGQHHEAIAQYERALALKPEFAAAHGNLGNVLTALSRHDEARARYERAAALTPSDAAAHFRLGGALMALKRPRDAVASYERALALRPGYVEARVNLGNALLALGQPEEAIVHYREALSIDPTFAEVHGNLGVALGALGQHDEALTHFQKAIALKPNYAEAYYSEANALVALDRLQEATERYEQAVALDPDHAAAHYNLGTVFAALRRHDDAIAAYERALRCDPVYPQAEWNRSLSLLSLGRFNDGWRAHESRWTLDGALVLPNEDRPLWSEGASMAGRRLLIQHEQGYGDAIQMLRYVPQLERAGAHCALQIPPALAALVQRSFPTARVVPLGHCPADIDLRVPMMSLPLAMRTRTESDIPSEVPYLVADQTMVAHWAARLATGRACTVGLVWRGLRTHANDRIRSLSLEAFAPLLGREHIQFVTLQKDVTAQESGQLARHDNVIVLDRAFDDTAAIMAALDLVISIDSAPAHLSGALARPTWILLHFSPDWRWLLEREDSSWYPTARLFRQEVRGDWATVISRVGAALDERVRAGSGADRRSTDIASHSRG